VAAAAGGGVEEKNYIMTPTGRVAVATFGTAVPVGGTVQYFHTDGLGSITAVTDENGTVVKRFAYDSWGKQIDPATGSAITSATNGHVTRSYTDHEMLADLGLVHMNGRVYDPVLGRFLSADPNVDGTYDSQGYNRYSYVGNNPMNRTDPSGYRSLGDIFKQTFFFGPHILTDPMYWASPKTFNQYYGQAAGIAATAVVLYYTGSRELAGAAGGFVSGFSSSLRWTPKVGQEGRLNPKEVQHVEETTFIQQRHEVHPVQVSQWKKEVAERLPEVFAKPSRQVRDEIERDRREKELYAEIGQLKMELDWLKKKVGPLGD
jgi:RHS repeat-associated protein